MPRGNDNSPDYELRLVLERYEAARRVREPLEEKWRRFWKLYRSDIDPEALV